MVIIRRADIIFFTVLPKPSQKIPIATDTMVVSMVVHTPTKSELKMR